MFSDPKRCFEAFHAGRYRKVKATVKQRLDSAEVADLANRVQMFYDSSLKNIFSSKFKWAGKIIGDLMGLLGIDCPLFE